MCGTMLSKQQKRRNGAATGLEEGICTQREAEVEVLLDVLEEVGCCVGGT